MQQTGATVLKSVTGDLTEDPFSEHFSSDSDSEPTI